MKATPATSKSWHRNSQHIFYIGHAGKLSTRSVDNSREAIRETNFFAVFPVKDVLVIVPSVFKNMIRNTRQW
jgi:hypothetical protein